MKSRFATVSKDAILAVNEAAVQSLNYQEGDKIWFAGVYRSVEFRICNKIIKNNPRKTVN